LSTTRIHGRVSRRRRSVQRFCFLSLVCHTRSPQVICFPQCWRLRDATIDGSAYRIGGRGTPIQMAALRWSWRWGGGHPRRMAAGSWKPPAPPAHTPRALIQPSTACGAGHGYPPGRRSRSPIGQPRHSAGCRAGWIVRAGAATRAWRDRWLASVGWGNQKRRLPPQGRAWPAGGVAAPAGGETGGCGLKMEAGVSQYVGGTVKGR